MRIVAALAGFALGWGRSRPRTACGPSRHDNTPISSSLLTPAGEDAVSGNGVTLTFPVSWVNVPTTPNKFAQFLQASAARFPHLWPALKDQLDNMPNLREVAMLVYRLNVITTATGACPPRPDHGTSPRHSDPLGGPRTGIARRASGCAVRGHSQGPWTERPPGGDKLA